MARRSPARFIWALIGKLAWFVVKVVASLGSRWARNRLERHREARRHPTTTTRTSTRR